jgi:hypothetical protein
MGDEGGPRPGRDPGLASATRTSQRLAEVVRSEVTDPYVEVYRRLLHRAIDRGEAPAGDPALTGPASGTIHHRPSAPGASTTAVSGNRRARHRRLRLNTRAEQLRSALPD